MTITSAILETLSNEVKPAMGCTEPVAIALATAKAKEIAGIKDDELKEINIFLSSNVFKNGMSVGIPGTKLTGLYVAGALGATGCQSEHSLEIFETVTDDQITRANKLIEEGKIKVYVADSDLKIYIEARVEATHDRFGLAVIQDRHDHFVYLQNQSEILLEKKEKGELDVAFLLNGYKISEIIHAVEEIEFSKIEYMLQGLQMNKKVAEYGLEHECGIRVGKILKQFKYMSDDFHNRSMILAAAASDARMSGAPLPVMSSNGSGNNGITALLPIVAYAEEENVPPEKLARAAAISHLVNSVIKHKIGRLSALCGCGVAAGTGAAVAIAWLMGANERQIDATIQNMLANTTGMICDGAKVGCALKLATSASAAIQAAALAMNDISVPMGNGILGNNCDESIDNLGTLSKEAMDSVDKVILNIMRKTASKEANH